MKTFAASTVLVTTLSGFWLSAQTPSPATPASRPEFDVVSIKPKGPGGPPLVAASFCSLRAAVLRCPAITVQLLIGRAYRLGDALAPVSRIMGGPDWTATTQFEVMATGADADPAALPRQLRALLEDRFKLTTHVETRSLPVYAFVLARDDGRLGPQMRPAITDCPPPPANQPQVGRNGEKVCYGGVYRMGEVVAGNITMARLADAFTNIGLNLTDRRVVDRTGLAGKFDVDLHWAADSVESPSLFTAVQEQLGLKMVPRNEPTEVLVIDHLEPPTPN